MAADVAPRHAIERRARRAPGTRAVAAVAAAAEVTAVGGRVTADAPGAVLAGGPANAVDGGARAACTLVTGEA